MTNIAPTRANFAMIAPLRVRYHEADMQGVVFNANYLVYADIAVTEHYRAMGMSGSANSFGPYGDIMVRKAEIDYLATAKADDLLNLCGRVMSFGNTSYRFEAAIFRGDELLTVIHITYVHFLLASGRPAPVPQDFRDAVSAFERVRPL